MRNQKSKTSIIILHGWGLCGDKYQALKILLEEKNHKVFAPDLPGFGAESLVNNNMNLDDYVVFLRKFIDKNKISKPIFIGHSFGGRVAIKYIWKYPRDVASLILTGVPIIRHASVKQKIAYVAAVIGGKVFRVFPKETQTFLRKVLYASIGEWDYYKAGPLRQVFKNIIGEELTAYVKNINIPTLLIWGKDDQIVPSFDVEKIKKIIPHAISVVVADEDHKLPYKNAREFFNAIKPVL